MRRAWALAAILVATAPAMATQDAWQKYQREDAGLAPALSFPYQSCFDRAATQSRLPVALLLAVARGESDFDARAISHANAHGLMQILWPGTARDLGFKRLSELYEPCRNVSAGARYLRELVDRYDGNLHLALAAYNYGPSRIRAGAKIPKGAAWYSAYIHRHLDYVLGRGPSALPDTAQPDYEVEAKMALITFTAPYRAQSFVERLQAMQPKLRLEWFREEAGRFRVMLLYQGIADLRRSQALLREAGFRLRKG